MSFLLLYLIVYGYIVGCTYSYDCERSCIQFFAGDGVKPDLTDEQNEILEILNSLSADQKKILLNVVRTFKE